MNFVVENDDSRIKLKLPFQIYSNVKKSPYA